MKRGPLHDEAQRARWQLAGHYGKRIDENDDFLAGIVGVKVRRIMIIVVDPDDNAVKAADFRHFRALPWGPKSLRFFFP